MSRSTIPWLRIVAEAAAIVGSILLAFWIDASWEARNLDREYRDIVAALTADFAATRADVETLEEINRAIISVADSISAELTTASGPVEVSTCDVVTLIRTPSQDLSMGELSALLASGNLRLVQDRDLRQALAEWPAAVSGVAEKVELQNAYLYDQFLPELRRVTRIREVVDARFTFESCSDDHGSVTLPGGREMANHVDHLRLMALRSVEAASWRRLTRLLDRIDAGLSRAADPGR